jgi:hypothetical protein
MKKARLEVGTDDMGTLQIEWANVAEVTAPGFFEVEDMAGRLFFGSLRRGPDSASVEGVADWGNDVLPLSQVSRIQLVKSGFWDRINGSIDAGMGYTSATELLQLDLDAKIKYRRPKFEASATADATRATSSWAGPQPVAGLHVLREGESMGRSDAEWAEWAREHRAAFEAAPLVEMRDAEKVQVGFTLTLYAAVPMDMPAGAEREQAALKVRGELRELAEAAVPESERGGGLELEPPHTTLLRPENEFRPEFGFTWQIFHGDDYLTPVTVDDRKDLARIEKRLVALGLKHGHW